MVVVNVQKGMVALLSAAAGGHVECVKLLIGHKCDVNIANPVRNVLSIRHSSTCMNIFMQLYYSPLKARAWPGPEVVGGSVDYALTLLVGSFDP